MTGDEDYDLEEGALRQLVHLLKKRSEMDKEKEYSMYDDAPMGSKMEDGGHGKKGSKIQNAMTLLMKGSKKK